MTKRQLIKLFKNYNYILLMGLSSALVLFKSYSYSFLLTNVDFADFNLYLLAVSVVALLSPLGFLLKCQSELPRYIRADADDRVVDLLGLTKSSAVVSSIVVFAIIMYFSDSIGLRLGIVQGFLYSLFFADQLVVKSRLLMTQYVWRVLVRNLVVSVCGVMAYFCMDSLAAVYLFEIIASLLLCLFFGNLRFDFDYKLISRVFANKSFLFVESMGMVIAMGDRVLAARFFSEEKFALYSYFYLVMTVATTFQQYINTRFYAEVSLSNDFSMCVKRATRRSVFSVFSCLALSLVMVFMLSYNELYFNQMSMTLLVLVVFLAVLKGCDYYQTLIIVFGYRKRLIVGQLVYVLLMLAGIVMIERLYDDSMMAFLLLSIAAVLGYYFYIFLVLWLLRRNQDAMLQSK